MSMQPTRFVPDKEKFSIKGRRNSKTTQYDDPQSLEIILKKIIIFACPSETDFRRNEESKWVKRIVRMTRWSWWVTGVGWRVRRGWLGKQPAQKSKNKCKFYIKMTNLDICPFLKVNCIPCETCIVLWFNSTFHQHVCWNPPKVVIHDAPDHRLKKIYHDNSDKWTNLKLLLIIFR